jgi:hypothetical protein
MTVKQMVECDFCNIFEPREPTGRAALEDALRPSDGGSWHTIGITDIEGDAVHACRSCSRKLARIFDIIAPLGLRVGYTQRVNTPCEQRRLAGIVWKEKTR